MNLRYNRMNLRYTVMTTFHYSSFRVKSGVYSYNYVITDLPIGNKFGIDFYWWNYSGKSITNFSSGIKITV